MFPSPRNPRSNYTRAASIEEYLEWPVSEVISEFTKRKLWKIYTDFSSAGIVGGKLAELLHEDDGELLASEGRYEEMSDKQFQHQMEMVGLPVNKRLDKSSMIMELRHLEMEEKAFWERKSICLITSSGSIKASASTGT